MFVWWYFGLIGCSFVTIIYCQDTNPLAVDIDQRNDQDVQVSLHVDNQVESPTEVKEGIIIINNSTTITQTQEPFACHECMNCNLKSDLTTRVCESGINMCYQIYKRINNTSRVIRRGCSTSKGQCTVADDDQSNLFDSITCCTSHKCNQGIQFKSFFFLSI